MSKTSMTEEELIDRCLQLNDKAQEELYNLYSSKMMGVTLRYVKTFEEAQDVLQDGFIKVFDKLDTYTREGSFEGWIRRIIVNTALDYLRKVYIKTCGLCVSKNIARICIQLRQIISSYLVCE